MGFSFLLVNITLLECYISVFIHSIVILITVQTLKPIKSAHNTVTESFRDNILIQKRSLVICQWKEFESILYCVKIK